MNVWSFLFWGTAMILFAMLGQLLIVPGVFYLMVALDRLGEVIR